MTSKILFQGAEATIIKQKNTILKQRIPKLYRHPEIDKKLITQRTRKEIKLLEKLQGVIKVPRVISFSENIIALEEIKGKRLSECLDKLANKSKIAKEIGLSLAKMHNLGIIHGDLTTSNMIYTGKEIYFIDFGLGYESDSIEDKAVDLHVLKEALNAKHPAISQSFFKSILYSYKSKDSVKVLERFDIVEKRGRYKAQY
ncbi:MAG TPA: KEOPS complex kinase/ATPase Bud32 [Candidatus Nanoarchaeia archaeon]|nr:KEOPS complex kinase/ATPase Bud32 [Candidatus Nanoarchaeia archaeon]